MKIFYCCYGSAHSSVLSAAIHTGKVSTEHMPKDSEILNLPHFDKTDDSEIGIPFYYGNDDMGNEVYIIGMGAHRKEVLNCILSFLHDAGVPSTDYVFINTLKSVGLSTRVGGFLSRKLRLIFLGRPMTVHGLKKVYFEFVNLVVNTKRSLRSLR